MEADGLCGSRGRMIDVGVKLTWWSERGMYDLPGAGRSVVSFQADQCPLNGKQVLEQAQK